MNICFVSSELAPYTAGGAGVVVAALARLLKDEGHRTRVLLVTADVDSVDEEWIELVRPGDDEGSSSFVAASRAAAEAVARVAHGVDLFEFQDFQGLGYWSLMRRRSLGLEDTLMAVRAHGPTDLISRYVEQPDPAQVHVSVMERHALAMADIVICAGDRIADEIRATYDLEEARVVVGRPPVPPLGDEIKPRRGANPEIAYVGTIAEAKGAGDFVEAAIDVAAESESVLFRLIGHDGWHTGEQRSMTAALQERIPPALGHRFEFVGGLPRNEMASALASAWAVATPSRFETFCLAAHEARNMGLPVIVPDIAGFAGLFSLETGALVYDGTVTGLKAAIQSAITDIPLLDKLELAPPPALADPAALYRGDLPPLRHPRAQAGMATAALARLEAALAPPPEQLPALHSRVAKWLNRLPFALARWISNRIPTGHPFRSLAAWHDDFRARLPQLEHRRALVRTARRQKPSPVRVSVVVACYNQGAFLEDALYSVLGQTFPDWEVIVVNDGSDDPDTNDLLANLRLPRVRVHHQANAGLPAARNAGMRLARGEFVVPLDADDELEPEFLHRLVAALDANPAAGVAHCWTRLFGDLNQIWVPPPLNPYRMLLSNSLVGCALIRRDAWRRVGGYDESMTLGNEDWDFWLRMIEKGIGMIEVPEPLFRYRRHGITMSVATEARFETARREVSDAHPDLYSRIEELKAEHYPLVSIVIGPGSDPATLSAQDIDDAEVLPIAPASPTGPWAARAQSDSLVEAVRAARGKYLIQWDDVGDAGSGNLLLLARHLEADDDAYAAGPSEDKPILWRTWSLRDPGAPHTHVAVVPGTLSVKVDRDWRGQFEDPRYSIRESRLGVDVVQVPPEAEGRIPDWVRF